MAEVGDQFGHARAVLVARLSPLVGEAYEQLADRTDQYRAAVRAVVASPRARHRVGRGACSTMCVVVCRASGHTATISNCSSTACRRALMRRKASSARWHWRCDWAPTDW